MTFKRPAPPESAALWLAYTQAQRELDVATRAASRDPTPENRRLRGAAEDRLTRAAAALAKDGGITFSPYPANGTPIPGSERSGSSEEAQ